ncbi:UNVERIFIED_ORG: phosphotransferase system glucose/maltose/N-acetylglucosamine-specific IIC component [Bacillus sp. 1751]|nr:phosphotransferase system glucose/maltose/N-acetylglucosamine-specific IIC component [Bacillus sp. 1751]
MIGSVGSTFLCLMVALSNIAQGSAVFAMMIPSKRDEKLKGLSLTLGISA